MVGETIVAQLDFARVSPSDSATAALIGELDLELAKHYPIESIHGLHPEELLTFRGVFLLGRIEGVAVACGAVRLLGGDLGELKRMYVRPSARRRGLGRRLLEELESVARELGLRTLRLETGTEQHEAVALYERAGYRSIAPYGEYVGNPYSLCYEKVLAS